MAAKKQPSGKGKKRTSSAKGRAPSRQQSKAELKKLVEAELKKQAKKEEAYFRFRNGISFPVFIMLCIFAALFIYGAHLEGELEISEPEQVTQNFIDKDADLAVHYIDVGQGDCSLVVYGEETLLIDAGEAEYGSMVSDYISSLGITQLDYVVATHPHSDHIGGLAQVIRDFDVETVIAPRVSEEMTPTSAVYKSFLLALKEKGLRLKAAKQGDVFSMADISLAEENDNTSFQILGPAGSGYEDLNDWSVIIKLEHGDTAFIFTGDAEKIAENDVLDSGMDVSADVLKVGHHGSSSSTGEDFLAAVSPTIAVIQCGDGNSYGHPHAQVTELLDEYGVKQYRTDALGTVVIYSDGVQVREGRKNTAEEKINVDS